MDAAIKKLSSFSAEGESEARRRFHLARAQASKGLLQDATKNLRQALVHDVAMNSARFNLACYLARAGRVDDAAKELEGLADRLVETHATSAARARYADMIKTDPDLAEVRKRRREQAAISHLEDARDAKTIAAKDLVRFKGCGRRTKEGELVEIKEQCSSFDGAQFGGLIACADGWVNIDEVVPKNMVDHLEGCIYEL